MTAKEKALELYNKFFREVPFLQSDDDIRDDMNAAKRCALIAVDELTKADYLREDFWWEVKYEIEKLCQK